MNLLKEYITVILEKKLKEEDSASNLLQLEEKEKELLSRITSLIAWRDSSKKGSINRDNYSRIISRLRAELKSVNRQIQKQKSLI